MSLLIFYPPNFCQIDNFEANLDLLSLNVKQIGISSESLEHPLEWKGVSFSGFRWDLHVSCSHAPHGGALRDLGSIVL